MVRRILIVGGLVVTMMMVTEAGLSAYIDPGPAFMFWQSVLAGVIGTAVFFQNAVRRVFRVLTRRRPEGD